MLLEWWQPAQFLQHGIMHQHDGTNARRDTVVLKEIAVRLRLVPNTGALEELDALASPALAAVMRRHITAMRAAFSEIEYVVDDVIAADDRVTVRWTRTATHTGTYQGLRATGRRVSHTGIRIWRFEADRAVEMWGEEDRQGLLEQLTAGRADASTASTAPAKLAQPPPGAIPSPEAAPDMALLSRMHHAIMRGFVRDGRAPHFLDLAAELAMTPAEARQTQRALLALPEPWWADPAMDLIITFRPFSNVPTQYRISVEGEQRWFGQCGVESLAVSWLFPGREVRIDSRCLDCGGPLWVRMRDGKLVDSDPETIVAHVNRPPGQPIDNWAYA